MIVGGGESSEDGSGAAEETAGGQTPAPAKTTGED